MKQFLNSAATWAGAATVVVGAFVVGVYGAVEATPAPTQSAAVAASDLQVELDPTTLAAKAVVLYDTKSGRMLYQKNAYTALPLASITKLLAVYTILSYKELDTPVQITKESLTPQGDWGLQPGTTLLLHDLIRMSLIASSNDAMEAAANSLGDNKVDLMNRTAASLGLSKTHVANATGLDLNATTAGAYGSAYDIARLGAAFYAEHPDLFELTTHADVSVQNGDRELSAPATALPLARLPGFVAAKTGYTDLAGGNLVAVFDLEPGRTVVGAVLGSTHEGRFSDMEALIQAARKAL